MPKRRQFPSLSLTRSIGARRRLVAQLRDLELRIRASAPLGTLSDKLRNGVITGAEFVQFLIDGGYSAEEASNELGKIIHRHGLDDSQMVTPDQAYEAEHVVTTRGVRLQQRRSRLASNPIHLVPVDEQHAAISSRNISAASGQQRLGSIAPPFQSADPLRPRR